MLQSLYLAMISGVLITFQQDTPRSLKALMQSVFQTMSGKEVSVINLKLALTTNSTGDLRLEIQRRNQGCLCWLLPKLIIKQQLSELR